MTMDDGRVLSAPGSREPSPEVSAASGFDPSRNATAELAGRYDAIFSECMMLAAVWRGRIREQIADKGFHADQHRRCLLRAASFARLAEKARARDSDGSGEAGETAKTGSTEGDSAGPKDIAQPNPEGNQS
jgi:hypothetical protein